MFRMTSNIKIEISNSDNLQPNTTKKTISFVPNSLKWKISVDDICDTANIVIPALCRLNDKVHVYENVTTSSATGDYFKVGDKIEIYAGYDGENDLQFKGFISRINFDVPLEIDCEGYSFQLKKNVLNKSYPTTTVKAVLLDLIKGTDIKISPKMLEEIEFRSHVFRNMNGIEILKFLKEQYHLYCYFEYEYLYVGFIAGADSKEVKHQLNWNVIKGNDLFFSTYQGSIVHIEGSFRNDDGIVIKVQASNNKNPGQIKNIKLPVGSKEQMQLIVNAAQSKENQKGYSGSLTTFLKPFVRPGMTTVIIDKSHKERNGRYYIESVEGNFNSNGGRQKISIAFGLAASKKDAVED